MNLKLFDRITCAGISLIVFALVAILLSIFYSKNVLYGVNEGLALTWLASFLLAGYFIGAFIEKKLEISELRSTLRDYKEIVNYYPVNPLEIVETRLREVALGWRDAKLALSDAHRMGPGECKSEYQKFRQEVERCTKLMEYYEETFFNLYDHAKRVFGVALPLQDRQIESYLPEKQAA